MFRQAGQARPFAKLLVWLIFTINVINMMPLELLFIERSVAGSGKLLREPKWGEIFHSISLPDGEKRIAGLVGFIAPLNKVVWRRDFFFVLVGIWAGNQIVDELWTVKLDRYCCV